MFEVMHLTNMQFAMFFGIVIVIFVAITVFATKIHHAYGIGTIVSGALIVPFIGVVLWCASSSGPYVLSKTFDNPYHNAEVADSGNIVKMRVDDAQLSKTVATKIGVDSVVFDSLTYGGKRASVKNNFIKSLADGEPQKFTAKQDGKVINGSIRFDEDSLIIQQFTGAKDVVVVVE